MLNDFPEPGERGRQGPEDERRRMSPVRQMFVTIAILGGSDHGAVGTGVV